MKYRILLSVFLILTTLLASADPKNIIPTETVVIWVSTFLVLGLIIAICVSLLLKFILQKSRKEKRKHIWYMSLLTFILPVSYGLAEEEFHLLYQVEVYFDYDTRKVVHLTLIILFIILGSIMGYLVTPKKKIN